MFQSIAAFVPVFLLAAFPVLAQAPTSLTGAARDLPSTVLAAFEKAHAGATITDTSQERQDGKVAFRVDALEKGRRLVVVYSLEGAVIEAAEQVEEADLPKAVIDAIHSYPKARFVKGMKVVHGLNVHYELTLRGTRKTLMIVKPDGSIVSTK